MVATPLNTTEFEASGRMISELNASIDVDTGKLLRDEQC